MNIQDALKETGFATAGKWVINWNSLDGRFQHTNPSGTIERFTFGKHDIQRDDWEPYHEVKEIKPKKAGELWERDSETNHRCVIYEDSQGLNVMWWGGDSPAHTDNVDNGIIHGKNGWTRLFPPVLTEEEMKADIRRILGSEDMESMLSEDDIELICDILHEEIQFYDFNGVVANEVIIKLIAESLAGITKETS